MSSSGNPISAKVAQDISRIPPTGTSHDGVSRSAAGPGRFSGSTIASHPAEKIPKRPSRMK